jgi:hypothetical protein
LDRRARRGAGDPHLACNHLCADRARFEDAVAGGDGPPAGVGLRRDLPFEQWRANLVDMAIGALLAPARRR